MDYGRLIEKGERELDYLEEDYDKGIITWEEYCEMRDDVIDDIKGWERALREEEEESYYRQEYYR